ncbi:MAG TPA: hypothetical protein VJ908_11355 [Wenzhouxiangellaceae bacterium]|nr:hypothetical protein [Wenzhouxiangellaceae bacterium]
MSRNAALTFMAIAGLLMAVLRPGNASALEQTIELEPGWNAIYVRLDPDVRDIEAVFADLPVRSVWRFIPDEVGTEFVTDPAAGLLELEGWFGWFPEPRPEAFLSNLFQISANTAYLVEMEGTQTRQITITGDPVFRDIRWRSDGFTLTGLPVSPVQPPSFAEFFEPSGAHRGQPVYSLSSDGRWSAVPPASTMIDSNHAYWVRTAGNSRFQGRMELVLAQGESLEYARALDQIQIVLRNRGDLEGSFQFERLTGDPMPIRFELTDPESQEIAWPALQDVLVRSVPARGEVFLTLGIRRAEMTTDRMEQSFAITDEHGGRILLHSGADTLQPTVQAVRSARSGSTSKAPNAPAFAGLWRAIVQIEAVSEAQLGGTQPTPVDKSFEQRMLIHVDAGGQARLLKDVILMWEDGTTVPSDQDPDLEEVETPGRYVLLTNKDLLPLYSGASIRNGEPVGRRFSTVAYDFPGEFLEVEGDFGPGGQTAVTLVLEPEFPTNPFRHKFHPDHDNKDAQFLNFKEEAFQVIREMRFNFAVEDPLGLDPPGWGSTLLGGQFDESITGIHKNTIFVSGSFRMRRISNVPVLNQ